MAADEQQAQNVVAVMGVVEPFGERRFGIVQVREELLGRQRFLPAPAPQLVERGVTADQDEPSGGVARRTALGPALQGPEARFLKSLLGRVEVAEVAQERSERPGPRGGQCGCQRGIVPGGVGHVAVRLPKSDQPTGRTSSEPVAFAHPNWRAASTASSRVAQSTIQKPRSCSLVSAKGPSMTSPPPRIVAAAVVGIRRRVGPSLPFAISVWFTALSRAMSSSSSCWVMAPTSASES